MPERSDPFEALRMPLVPQAPRPEFAAQLRRRIEAALAVVDSPTREVTDVSMTTTITALSPYLSVAGAARAIDWYRDVFGAIETMRYVADDGRVGHAELDLGGSRLMLADEYPEYDIVGPTSRGGASVTLHFELAHIDDVYRRAIGAGAHSDGPPTDQGHGNRNAAIVDPFGHRWLLSEPIDAERAAAVGDQADWTVTGRTPVEPGYLVIHTPDLDRASAFYRELFGWEVQPGSVEGGGHVGNTRFPLGLAPPVAGGEATGVLFRVDDAESFARRVTELGGEVVARSEHRSGVSVECTDDQGYRFELWQPAPGY